MGARLILALGCVVVMGCGTTDLLGDASADHGAETDTGDTDCVSGYPDVVEVGEPECLPHNYDLEELTGAQGIIIDGIPDLTWMLGWLVSSAGDVNGDGYDDVLISDTDYCDGLDPPDDYHGTRVLGPVHRYLIFGGPVGARTYDLSSIDGTNGLLIAGKGLMNASTGAGDVDGDGFGDLLIGQTQPQSVWEMDPGEAILVYGGCSIGSGGLLELGSLTSSQGIRFEGIHLNDWTGASVAGAGDVNGDDFPDFLIGASYAGSDDSHRPGAVYLVYGGPGLRGGGTIELSSLNGRNGVRLNGREHGDSVGSTVSGAGDVNGDGFDDVLTATGGIYAHSGESSNEVYIVYGGTSIGVDGELALATLDGRSGIRLGGLEGADHIGFRVSGAGDVNGDLYDDLVFVAIGANWVGVDESEICFIDMYIVYGGLDIGIDGWFDLGAIDGTNGFRITGFDEDRYETKGLPAGDVNADGFADMLVSVTGRGYGESAEVYLLLGSTDLAPGGDFDLRTAGEPDGVMFMFMGSEEAFTEELSFSGAGDFNADGHDDLLFAARHYPYVFPLPHEHQGRGYIVFGGPTCL